jgi:hypothetical protein
MIEKYYKDDSDNTDHFLQNHQETKKTKDNIPLDILELVQGIDDSLFDSDFDDLTMDDIERLF